MEVSVYNSLVCLVLSRNKKEQEGTRRNKKEQEGTRKEPALGSFSLFFSPVKLITHS